jgi:hypothetical protein
MWNLLIHNVFANPLNCQSSEDLFMNLSSAESFRTLKAPKQLDIHSNASRADG